MLSKKIFINAFFSEFKQIGYEFVKEAAQRKLKMEEAYNEAVSFCEANQVASMSERRLEK